MRKKNKDGVSQPPEVLDTSKNAVDEKDIASRVAVAAYYKALARGYEPGHEIQDWIEAEAEILKQK